MPGPSPLLFQCVFYNVNYRWWFHGWLVASERHGGQADRRQPRGNGAQSIQRSQDPPETEVEISLETKKKQQQQQQNQQQQQQNKTKQKPNGYYPQKDQINTFDRRTQTTIFRLCTGHCGLRKRPKRLGLADSAHGKSGAEEQTPEHILQTCPHLETVRQQFWPEDTEVGTKLWGQAAELHRTADFLAATGLRI